MIDENFIKFGSDVNKVLIIDFSNFAYRNAFITIKKYPMDNGVWKQWKKKCLGDIINYVGKFSTDRLILATDSFTGKYWRHEIYALYKQNRLAFHGDKVIDVDSFKIASHNFINEFKNIFTNTYIINVENCESDDIIAVLCKELSDCEKIIISNDGDFNQLLKLYGVKKFDPLQNRFINIINPKHELEIKVIIGDKNDGIPSIKSGIGEKTAEKIVLGGMNIMESSDISLRENYKRNKILIDFDFIPERISKMILNEYNNYKITPISNKLIYEYMLKHECQDKWQINGQKIVGLK